MDAPRIYRSPLPDIPTCNVSVYTHLFQNHNHYPSSSIAYIDAASGDSITRGLLKKLTLELAYGLMNSVCDLGPTHERLKKGDVIMIFSPNSLSWPIMLFGAVAAGLRITLASSSSTAEELSWQWKDSGAKMIVVAPSHAHIALDMFILLGLSWEEALSRIYIMDRLWEGSGKIPMNDGFNYVKTLLGQGCLQHEIEFDGRDADETVYICYSSGTTGRPKGVESSHRGAGSVFSMAWEVFKSIKTERDVSLALLPFYHIFGLIAHLHHSFYLGIPTVIMNGFDPVSFCQAIERHKVTMCMVAPPILHVLAHHPNTAKFDLSSLTALISGAAPLSPALVESTLSRLARCNNSHPKIINGYGSTETTLTVMVVPPESYERKIGSVGVLAPNLEVRLVKKVTKCGAVVDSEEGEEGELWVRGPTIMKGYLHNPKATAASLWYGWYMTGDILRRDEEGFYWVVDRKKEMIKYKGHQVAPAELEAVLLENPAIQDVGVIGVRDAYSGNELPRAYVVPVDGSLLSSPAKVRSFQSEVQEWVKGKLAAHKWLRGGVVVTPAIPKR